MNLNTRKTLTKVLDIHEANTWRGIGCAIQSLIPAAVRKSAASHDADRMYSDSMEYLISAFSDNGEYRSRDEIDELGQVILKSLTHLRAFHACKPLSLEPYFTEGLQPLTIERLTSLAGQYLEGHVTPSGLLQAAREADLSLREGRIYFGTDAADLIQNAGHYLIYGPESLCCLFKTHGPTSNLRLWSLLEDTRRKKGIPTLFECHVPIEWIDEAFRLELGCTVLTRYFQRRAKRGYNDWNSDWSFSISRPLPQSLIIGHIHPTEIPDHIRLRMPFKNPITVCPWCATGPRG